MSFEEQVTRDFDAERAPAKSMRLRGQVLHLMPDVHPARLSEWNDIVQRNVDHPEQVSETMMTEAVYTMLRSCIVPDDREALEVLLAEEGPNMVGAVEMGEQILPWVIEQITGRPFERRSTSLATPERTPSSTASMDDSDSRPAVELLKPPQASGAS